MSTSAGLALYKLAFQLSPIMLVGGVAQGIEITGGMLPILAITEAANFTTGLLTGNVDIDLDGFFAHWAPLPGGDLISQQIGSYPFANLNVAANATIAQPLNLSMQMQCPARGELGMPSKLASMMLLKVVLDKHNQTGGTYTVVTPSYIYQGGVLISMRDISNTASHQVQNTWQLDFNFPLLTLEAAQAAQNSLMNKLGSGTQISGAPGWSGASSGSSLATGSTMIGGG